MRIKIECAVMLTGLLMGAIGCLPEMENVSPASSVIDNAPPHAVVDGSEVSELLPPVVVAEYDLAALEDAGAFQYLEKRDVRGEDDPLYKSGPRRFHGYALSEILALLDGFSDFSAKSHKMVWVCEDGYRTTYDFDAIIGGIGVLAIGLSEREGYAWESYTRGKMTLSPAPFYLVWEGEGADNRRPWPYQLTKLQVVSSERVAMRLETPDPHLHGEGEGLYKKHCMSCHSMNLIGGLMGPEMNVPRNILEYRSEADFIAFASDPQAFRTRSPMPKMRYLGEDKLKKITGYVRSMSVRKVCVSAMGCAEYADALK